MPESQEDLFALFNFHSVPVRTVEIEGKQHVVSGSTAIPCHGKPMARFPSIEAAAVHVIDELKRIHGERFNDSIVPMWARPKKEAGDE